MNLQNIKSAYLYEDEYGQAYLNALIFSSWMADSGEDIKNVFSTLAFSFKEMGLSIIRVYYDSETLYGFAYLAKPQQNVNATRIHYMAVNPKYRNMGVGSFMLNDIKSGFEVINLVSANSALNFYKKNGFFEGGLNKDNQKIMFFSQGEKNLEVLNEWRFYICALDGQKVSMDWDSAKKAFLGQLRSDMGEESFQQMIKAQGVNLSLIERTAP